MNIKILLVSCVIYFVCIFGVYASAWTRKQNEFFGLFEILDESQYSKTLFSNSKDNFYRNNSYKFYFEYGLTDWLTFGGYLRNYNFYSKGTFDGVVLREKVRNDYYGNIFLIQNLYNKNSNVFSIQYSYYFPIKYSDLSKQVNTVDTRNAFEFGVLFGRDDDFTLNDLLVRYFLNTSLNFKIVDGIDYNQITFATTLGFRLNDSSTLSFYYEYQYYLEDDLFDKDRTLYNYYEGYNTNKLKLSFNYKFMDNLSTELSFYRNFSNVNSSGISFSFIFNNL